MSCSIEFIIIFFLFSLILKFKLYLIIIILIPQLHTVYIERTLSNVYAFFSTTDISYKSSKLIFSSFKNLRYSFRFFHYFSLLIKKHQPIRLVNHLITNHKKCDFSTTLLDIKF